MIVRIASEQQFRIPDSDKEPLNRLDNSVVEAVENNDEQAFLSSFDLMIKFVV